MEALPIEIITYVMRLLTLEDRNSCSLVCKKWYSALQDPSISSRLVCRIDIQNDAKEVTEVATFARSRLISHLTICDNCPSAQCCEETMFWTDKDIKFEMITTLSLDESVDHERVKILMSFATNFINVKIVEMYSSFLFEALDDIANRDKVIHALQKIPQLHLVVEGHYYYKLPTLLNMKFNFCLLLFKNEFFVISKNRQNELVTTFRSRSDEKIENSLPLHDLIAFCSQHQCALHLQFVRLGPFQFKLSEVVDALRCFLKLSIESLNLTHILTPIMKEEGSYLQQISYFGLNYLTLSSASYVHDWLSKEFLSSVILGCESLIRIQCFGKFDKITLVKIFSYCPFAESVDFTYTHDGKCEARCSGIAVTYRTALNSHLKVLCLQTLFPDVPGLTCLDLLSVVPLHLREFSMTIARYTNDPTVLTKLNDRCPNIRKLTITLKTKSIHNFLGEMGNLEELAIINCVKNVTENMSFPCLKKLALSFQPLTDTHTVFEIVRAFQGIKSLNLMYWTQGCSRDGLKEGLSVLTEFEELKLDLKGHVNGETFETLSSLAPPLTSLTLYKSDDNDFGKHLRRFQNMHPNVKVTFFRTES